MFVTITKQRGVTLIEVILFIVVLSIALVAILRVFNLAVTRSVDPLIRVRAIEIAQGQLDEILSRRFDENTPVGGVPACNSTNGAHLGVMCLGITADTDFDDVGDYHLFTQAFSGGYMLTVNVTEENAETRRISVTVDLPALSSSSDASITLSAYRVNF